MRGVIRLFRSNCPREVQKRISLEAAILCSKSEARFSHIAQERWLKTSFILGSLSSLSSPELSLSSCSLSCSSSTNLSLSSFWWALVARRSFEWSTVRCVTSFIALEILSLKQQEPTNLQYNHYPFVQGLTYLFCKGHLVWPGQVKHPYMSAISGYFLRGWKCVP